jgi:pseudouridine-5'-phosphate glycosidase
MRASVACRFACAPIRKASPLSRLASTPLARYVSVSEEVQDARHRSQPIVSLETAITSHGLPYDKAITVAASLDAIIRKQGAVPAVIGLIDGIVKVGLSDAEIQRLAGPPATKEAAERKWKVGKRDISPALVKKVDGGTTVSATSFLSHLVGIETFVTG